MMWFGGDYNPEQWPRDVWDDDVRLMKRAGVTVATVGVFSWARIEPREGEFDFVWLDEVLDLLHANGIGVDLATATAAPPPWVLDTYPAVRPVTAEGVTLAGSSRQTYSPHSADYRRLAERLVTRIAERYASHPALVAWHVNNEYGCHVSRSYDDEGAVSFRVWLAEKYGSIEALNAAWGTMFWSQRFASFAEIQPPRAAPTDVNPTHLLDFDRFSSKALLDLFRMEAGILRAAAPGVPVTTNFMGAFKQLDYWAWAREVDFVSDDSYPDPADPDAPVVAAFARDLMRSLGRGKPWVLMEQATSAVNWRHRNAMKPAGMMRALSLQAIARGSDGVMFFQWRQSRRGSEKFHSAMVPHAGEGTRIYREVEALGLEVANLDWIRDEAITAHVAMVLDWDSWWALERPSQPTTLDYLTLLLDWYRALWKLGVMVDFVPPDGDLSAYDVVIAPQVFVMSDAAASNLAAFAEAGGRLVIGFQTGIVDPDLGITEGGYLGRLQHTLGITIEEFAPLAFPDQFDRAPVGVPSVGVDGATGGYWSEVVKVHAASVLAKFTDGDVAGLPAITRNGTAWYVATHPDDALMTALLADVLGGSVADPGDTALGDGVELIRRGAASFVINHRREPRTARVDDESVSLSAFEVVMHRSGGSWAAS